MLLLIIKGLKKQAVLHCTISLYLDSGSPPIQAGGYSNQGWKGIEARTRCKREYKVSLNEIMLVQQTGCSGKIRSES